MCLFLRVPFLGWFSQEPEESDIVGGSTILRRTDMEHERVAPKVVGCNME